MPEERLDPKKLYKLPKSLTHLDRQRIENEVPKKMSRSEAKEKKDLEEARKVSHIWLDFLRTVRLHSFAY